MPLDKFLEGFEYDPETFDPETFKQNAMKEYESDRETWNGKVKSVETERETLAEKVTRLQVHNYDLLMATGQKVPDPKEPGAAGTDGASKERADPIKSLFKKA